MNTVIVSTCSNYNWQEIYKVISLQLEKLIDINKIKNKTVLLKPNLLAGHPPEKAVTTHPEFLRAVIRLFKDKNTIIVADSPSVANFEEVVLKTGIRKVCQEENVELINISTYPVVEFEFKKLGIKNITVSRILRDVDFIINLPKLKTHSLTVFTCAVKNMYGVVPGFTKSLYHKYAPHPQDFIEVVYAIYNFRKPDLTIVDGIIGMDKEGPAGGNVKNFNLIISSLDGVCVDWFLAKKILKLKRVLFYKNEHLKPAQIIYINFKDETINNSKVELPQTVSLFQYLPKFVLNLAKKLIWFRPVIVQEKCKRCGKCYEICPKKTIIIIDKKYIITYKECISCFCCYEACPYKSIEISQSPLLVLVNKLKKLLQNV